MAGELAPILSGIPVVASTTERDQLYPSPTRDQRVWIRSTGDLYIYDGVQWVLSSPAIFAPKGSKGDGITDDYAALVASDAAAVAAGALHTLPHGLYRVATNLTLAAPIQWGGGILKPDSGVTVTITATPNIGHVKWIDTSAGGKVVFAAKAMARLSPAWWGAVADYDILAGGRNGTDNAAAFQAMAASMAPTTVAQGYRIQLPSGAMRISQGFVLNQSGTLIEGDHREASWIIFDPPSDGAVCILVQRAGGLEFFGGGMRQFRISTTSTNDRQKYGIRLVDVSEFFIEDVVVNRLSTDTDANAYPHVAVRRNSNPSVGLHVQGREFLRLNRFTSFADRPIWIDNNPNYPGAPGAPTSIDLRIDCDTFDFRNLYLAAQSETEANILMYGAAVAGTLLPSGTMYGLNLQNFVFTGSNTVVGPGRGFLKYAVSAGQNWHSNRSLIIENVRAEGMVDDTGICIDIEVDSSALEGVMIRNVQPGSTNGIKLRGCVGVTIQDYMYSGVAANPRNTIDVDGTCDNIIGHNVRVAAGANNLVSIGTLRKVWAVGDTTSGAIERNFWLAQGTSVAHPHVIGNDPDNGSACYEFENSSGQRFRLIAGVPGVTNSGMALKDMTNAKMIWHYVNGILVLDQPVSCSSQFILPPPNLPVYGTSVTINTSIANAFIITATNGTGFTIGAPLSAGSGQRFVIQIRNTSGGALGAVTWNAAYKMAAWSPPATGFNTSIEFLYDGTNAYEIGRSTTNIPN